MELTWWGCVDRLYPHLRSSQLKSMQSLPLHTPPWPLWCLMLRFLITVWHVSEDQKERTSHGRAGGQDMWSGLLNPLPVALVWAGFTTLGGVCVYIITHILNGGEFVQFGADRCLFVSVFCHSRGMCSSKCHSGYHGEVKTNDKCSEDGSQ